MHYRSLILVIVMLAVCVTSFAVKSPADYRSLLLNSAFLHSATSDRNIHREYYDFYPEYWQIWYQTDYIGATNWSNDEWDGTTWVNRESWDVAFTGSHPSTVTITITEDGETTVMRFIATYGTGAASGLPVMISLSAQYGAMWIDVLRESYTYDANGVMSSYLDESTDLTSWNPTERGTSTITDGHITQLLMEEYYQDAWLTTGRYDLTWTGGQMTQLTESAWSDPNWINQNQIDFTYTGAGYVQARVYKSWMGAEWSVQSRTTDEYTGTEISHELEELYDGTNWTNHHQVNFTLQGDQYQTWTEQEWSGGQWVNNARATLTYGVANEDAFTPAVRLSARAYPNPFNPSARIEYSLPSAGQVTLNVYDLRGQLVRTLVSERQNAGEHNTSWNGTTDSGSNAASGIYLYRVVSGGLTTSGRMTLMK
jgi:hypothetical protein